MPWARGILQCETNPAQRRGQLCLSKRHAANGLPIKKVNNVFSRI